MEKVIQWSQGNPGALSFLMSLLNPDNKEFGDIIFSKLEELESIRGTNLYILWSDLCNQDNKKVLYLLQSCPSDILEDACSRQDYSGKELVSKYFE